MGTHSAPDLFGVIDDDEEYVVDRAESETRKLRSCLTPDEMRVHHPAHVHYNPACRRYVIGRKRDHYHRRREDGVARMNAELQASNGRVGKLLIDSTR